MCVELLTPDGNWSSYPPHRHDDSPECPVNNEEIYYFRVGRAGTTDYAADGFAMHRTYTPEGDVDATVTIGDGDVFLVHRGYHGPCAAAPGYPLYYLNVLAGPGGERSMAFCDDPAHHWVRDALGRDGRRPTRADAPEHRPVSDDRAADDGGGDRPLPRRPAHGHRRREAPLVPGVFAIFGHGNVTCLGPALHAAGDELPTWRGQNEQGMALAAIAYAKAMRRRQLMVATTSIGPGALNLVTAAGVAMANRLPVLLLSGDTFQSRFPDPVLQQVEHFGSPVDDGQRRLPGRRALLGPDHPARAGDPVAAPGARRDARSGGLRAGVHRPAPGRPGGGLRLPAAPVRAGRPRGRSAAPRRRPARRGGRRRAPSRSGR